MQPPNSTICVICGIRRATTRDHVPPKGFFKGLGLQQPTVPACAQCNNGASSDDEDMRFFIGTQVGKQSAASASVWETGARKSLRRKKSLQHQMQSTARDIQVRDSDGKVVTRLAFEVPASVYESVFGRTTRGLYFFHTGRILDPAAVTAAQPLASRPDEEFFAEMAFNEIGGHACRYWYQLCADAPNASVWLYCFHDLHWVYVATGEACELDVV